MRGFLGHRLDVITNTSAELAAPLELALCQTVSLMGDRACLIPLSVMCEGPRAR
jgi:hypothetical protein